MSRRIEYETIFEFSQKINTLRQIFPELARELDQCLFEVMNKYTPKCGHGTCPCQTMTAEQFHVERNLLFGTTKQAQSREFN